VFNSRAWKQIGREEGLSYDEVKSIFSHVSSSQNCWESVKRVSIDEISMRKGKGNFVTVVILKGNLIEMIDSSPSARYH
jgi:hypothetical protein